MIFENSLPKANFGQNIRDSPNGSLTADSRSLQTATLKLSSYHLIHPTCAHEIIVNRPFYPYGGHIELIGFKEYYGMPRGHDHDPIFSQQYLRALFAPIFL